MLERQAGRCAEHFELYDPEFANEYPDRISEIRTRCPVLWSDAHWSGTDTGFWMLSDYRNVAMASESWKRFSSAQGAAPIQFDLEVFRMLPLESDAPLHRNIRRVLAPFFGPEAVDAADSAIEAIVRELIDDCTRQSSCDFVESVAVRLPARVLFEVIVGEPPENSAWMLKLIDALFASPESAVETAPDLLAWCWEKLESRRAEGRTDDPIGAIAHAGTEGDGALDDVQRISTVMLLILGGMETTAAALSHIGYRLASDPVLRGCLATMGPDELDRAVDEFLRFDTPVPAAARTLTEDVEVGGCPLHKGDRVILNWCGANRDPAAFANPDVLDITRPDANKHMAFGHGPHRCLGTHLAKREIRHAIQAVCALKQFELQAGTKVIYRAGPERRVVAVPVDLAK